MPECSTLLKYDESEVSKLLSDFKKNSICLNKNKIKLRGKYKDMYIAIKEGEIIGANENVDELYNEIEYKGIDLNKVLIEFIPSDEIIYIL